MLSDDTLRRTRLVRQSYGIAMAQNKFGGPRGVWLECKGCDASERIVFTPGLPEDLALNLSDADAAQIFRHHKWTGEGDTMRNPFCPKCTIRIYLQDGRYYADGRCVMKAPHETGRGVTLGFCVCELSFGVSDDGAKEIADALNFADSIKSYTTKLPEPSSDGAPERLYLQNIADASPDVGQLWCRDKVWPDENSPGEPVEYVRADIARTKLFV